MVEFDKPLVAAAQGVAVGGGATVLFHADIVYVGESLRMRLPFASLGLAPEWGSSYMLQANIGAQRAAELFYTAEWVDADKAHNSGIAADVLPDANLFEHALAKAQEIAQWPVNSLREIKRYTAYASPGITGCGDRRRTGGDDAPGGITREYRGHHSLYRKTPT